MRNAGAVGEFIQGGMLLRLGEPGEPPTRIASGLRANDLGLKKNRKVSMVWPFVIVVGAVVLSFVVMRYRAAHGGPNMTSAELVGRLERNDCLVLDVRSADEYSSGHIPGARNVPHHQVARRLEELKSYRDKDIAVCCEVGLRAHMARKVLAKAGFEHVYHLTGDMAGWRREGLPLHTGATP